ncbi:type II toxin-antitoxin system Phd/YefM family antitoxin [Gordonia sp. (in: high G+C Gram-positive bacteria)]|uniref:type II toxin-antitoxin system Phd/YefM family antitoxin n=1 Tax=Gordonia sp. (in: high G+C Gram-positive bacteria) TaxID=84139 RepID=UPI0039E29FBF
MKTITMTEFNQRVSAVTREVIERGEAVRVTNRGRVVLRVVPEPVGAASGVEALIEAGLANRPKRPHARWAGRPSVVLSRSVEELLDEVRGDTEP